MTLPLSRNLLSSLALAASRAKAMINAPVPYVLGAGGRKPMASTPIGMRNGRRGCDCVGFTAWCAGFDRFQKDFPLYGGWINTDSSLGRWNAKTGQWDPADCWFLRLEKPVIGCWIVYPSVDLDNDGDRDRIGHVGIVTSVACEWSWATTKVVHCSSSASRAHKGRAIQETTAELWARARTFRGRTAPRYAAAFVAPLVGSIGHV